MEKIFADAAKKGGESTPERNGEQVNDGAAAPKKFPKGVVLGKDGKPFVVLTGSKSQLVWMGS